MRRIFFVAALFVTIIALTAKDAEQAAKMAQSAAIIAIVVFGGIYIFLSWYFKRFDKRKKAEEEKERRRKAQEAIIKEYFPPGTFNDWYI